MNLLYSLLMSSSSTLTLHSSLSTQLIGWYHGVAVRSERPGPECRRATINLVSFSVTSRATAGVHQRSDMVHQGLKTMALSAVLKRLSTLASPTTAQYISSPQAISSFQNPLTSDIRTLYLLLLISAMSLSQRDPTLSAFSEAIPSLYPAVCFIS